jgi:hypothetical protein
MCDGDSTEHLLVIGSPVHASAPVPVPVHVIIYMHCQVSASQVLCIAKCPRHKFYALPGVCMYIQPVHGCL